MKTLIPLMLILASCKIQDAVQVSTATLTLQHIKPWYRYGIDPQVVLSWHGSDNVDYWQAVPAEDSSMYRVGQKSVVLRKR